MSITGNAQAPSPVWRLYVCPVVWNMSAIFTEGKGGRARCLAKI